MVGLLVIKPWGAKKKSMKKREKAKKGGKSRKYKNARRRWPCGCKIFSEVIVDSVLRTQNRFTRVDANESYNIQLHFAKKMNEKIHELQDL